MLEESGNLGNRRNEKSEREEMREYLIAEMGRILKVKSMVYVLAIVWCGASLSQEAPQLRVKNPSLEQILEDVSLSVVPVDDVSDPVLAYLVALLEADVLDSLTGDEIRRGAHRLDDASVLPIRLLDSMVRAEGTRMGERFVSGRFSGKRRIPSPYSILGYHPGAVVMSPHLALVEWTLGNLRIRERRHRELLDLDDCYLWAIIEGTVTMDVDAWLDKLLGGKIDDTRVTSLALFKFRGTRYVTAMGYNENGKGRTGVMNLTSDEFLFPISWEFKTIGKHLRKKAELKLQHAMACEQASRCLQFVGVEPW